MLAYISQYLLPFFLYLFLIVLLTDLLLLINMLKIIPETRIRNRTFRNRIFIVILILAVLIVAAGSLNFQTVRITHYEVETAAGSSRLKKLRIAFISDFHLNASVPHRFVLRYAEKMKDIDPDVILYGGDILEGSGENIHAIEKIESSLKPGYGKFAAPGNHDRIIDTKDNYFQRTGIMMLRDSIVTVDSCFSVAGREDVRHGDRLNASGITSLASPDLPLIVIDHRPTEHSQLSETTADMVFSGHTHEGQMFPINLYLKKVYELSYGYLKKDNTHFFVSSGIRLWGPPVRTIGRSEIVVVDVTLTRN
jgi:predicted MPP superfamily phosphohydrolase